ncbi:MAG TPA: hypothetical protein VMW85_04290 [Methanomassiliicoccales archaeon]|nr:hypothetical protein [Methanomassiliicoccales archaeon]
MRTALVVGLGAAGTFASICLAKKGWKVLAVGKGTSSCAMSTGCLDGSGMDPECLRELSRLFQASGMPLVGGIDEKRTGITNLGTRYDCTLSAPGSTWVQGHGPRSITVLGMGKHPSLRPNLVASVLRSWGMDARPQIVPMDIPGESSLTAAFRDQGHLDRLVNGIREAWGETVLLPPLFSLKDHGRLDELERRGGRRLLEAITPLGTPGERFHQVLEDGAREAGVEIWTGRRVTALRTEGDLITGADVQGGLETRTVGLDAVLLATGGPLTDGLLLHQTGLDDPFGLFLVKELGQGPHDLMLSGYAHRGGRLLSRSGTPMANAFAAGDCLAYSLRSPGKGLGDAISSAWGAVRTMEVP